jgi:hypothetical protein
MARGGSTEAVAAGARAEALHQAIERVFADMTAPSLVASPDRSKSANHGKSAVYQAGLRPDADEEAQATVSADIDAIVKRLDEGIPRLDARLDRLLERQRRLLTV